VSAGILGAGLGALLGAPLPGELPQLHLDALRPVADALGPRLDVSVERAPRWTDVQLVGCGHIQSVRGSSLVLQARGRLPCQVRLKATHRVTLEPVTSEPITVDGSAEDQLTIDLQMPRRWGQLGLLVFPEGDGTARITRLDGDPDPDNPLLVDGAVVTAIDGIPVDHFSPEELVALDAGPLGSELIFTIEVDGVEEDVELVREVSTLARTRG
jgi:hypothetical protein